MLNRRSFMTTTALALLSTKAFASAERFPLDLTDAEWRARLTPAQYAVLREQQTENSFSSALLGERSLLLGETRPGTYNCAGCSNPLYRSETKFDSKSGWPSFWQPLQGGISTREDRSLIFIVQTEVHCANCGGHQGHVFNDGPAPTGKRHCINGLAMTFTPDATGKIEGFPVAA